MSPGEQRADQLIVENGPTVELRGRPAQGTRHRVAFGVLAGTGEQVAVKLERVPGALARERAALAWLGARDGPAPRLLAAGTAVLGGERAECLVTERRSGSPPTSLAGWRRMGRAYARLADLTDGPPGLPRFDHATFGGAHAQRIEELGGLLDPLAAAIPDWSQLSSARVPGSAPLVITHGDPGPGNFLDDGRDGVVIDWEDAQIAPRGLDLARLAVIALLGAGPEGYPAREQHERAIAAVDGYLESLRGERRRGLGTDWGGNGAQNRTSGCLADGSSPSEQEWRWWLAVAGIQFVHGRWQRHGPAPWQEAARVLWAALAEGTGPADMLSAGACSP